MNSKKMAALVTLILSTYALNTEAQSPDACSAILQYGIWDKHRLFTTSKEFDQVQSMVCKKDLYTEDEARSFGGSVDVNVIDIVKGALGANYNSSNFRKSQQDFCASNYQQHASDRLLLREVSTASKSITDAWSTCVATVNEDMVAYLTPLTKGADAAAFSIDAFYKTAHDPHTWDLLQLGVAPAPVGKSCDPPTKAEKGISNPKFWMCTITGHYLTQPISVKLASNRNNRTFTLTFDPRSIASSKDPSCVWLDDTGSCKRCEWSESFSLGVNDHHTHSCTGMKARKSFHAGLRGHFNLSNTNPDNWVELNLNCAGAAATTDPQHRALPMVIDFDVPSGTVPDSGVTQCTLTSIVAQVGDPRIPGNAPLVLSTTGDNMLYVEADY